MRTNTRRFTRANRAGQSSAVSTCAFRRAFGFIRGTAYDDRERGLPDDDDVAVEKLGDEGPALVHARLIGRSKIANPAAAGDAPDHAVVTRNGRVRNLQIDADAATDDDGSGTDRHTFSERLAFGHDQREIFGPKAHGRFGWASCDIFSRRIERDLRCGRPRMLIGKHVFDLLKRAAPLRGIPFYES
jgi:hypothetical protein